MAATAKADLHLPQDEPDFGPAGGRSSGRAPSEAALALPGDVEIRASAERLIVDDGDDDDRVTDPGPPNRAWGAGASEWDDEGGSPGQSELEYDDDPTGPGRAAPGTLRARPRRMATTTPEGPTAAPPARLLHNERPEPVAVHLGVPLFTDDVAFVRRPVATPAREAPAPKLKRSMRSGWLPWLLVGALALFSAIGWSAIRSTRSAARQDGQVQRTAPDREAR